MRTYLHESVLSVTQGQYRDRDRCHTEVGLHEDAAIRLSPARSFGRPICSLRRLYRSVSGGIAKIQYVFKVQGTPGRGRSNLP